MEVIADSIGTIIMIIAIILMGMITYCESDKEISVLRRRLMETDNTVRSLRDTNSRLSYLEWRVSHPEIEFAPIDEEQIAFDAKFASGKIVKDIISDTTGDVLKVKVFFNSGDNRQLEDAMNLKALLEKYGTQLFK